jgi:hypothetical protein
MDWYKTGCRIFLLIERKKDGSRNSSDHRCLRLVSRCETEFDDILAELKEKQANSERMHRIYSSINKRNAIKAMHLFKRRMLEMELHRSDRQVDFFLNSTKEYLSCLAQLECRASKLILVDVDGAESLLNEQLAKLEDTSIIDVRKTYNGYHIITEPFNLKQISLDCDIHRDGMILHV